MFVPVFCIQLHSHFLTNVVVQLCTHYCYYYCCFLIEAMTSVTFEKHFLCLRPSILFFVLQFAACLAILSYDTAQVFFAVLPLLTSRVHTAGRLRSLHLVSTCTRMVCVCSYACNFACSYVRTTSLICRYSVFVRNKILS